MIPVNFKEANSVLGSENPDFLPLPVGIVPGISGQLNTCWELTEEEIEEIQKTGRIWLSILSFGNSISPVFLSSTRPKDYDSF